MNDGGTAFPSQLTDAQGRGRVDLGMTLRDYFAAKALGYIGHLQAIKIRLGESFNNHEIAAMCYEIADAMIKARNEEAG